MLKASIDAKQPKGNYLTEHQSLKEYAKNDYYSGDRELTAKHVAAIADKLGKDFTNINNRY